MSLKAYVTENRGYNFHAGIHALTTINNLKRKLRKQEISKKMNYNNDLRFGRTTVNRYLRTNNKQNRTTRHQNVIIA